MTYEKIKAADTGSTLVTTRLRQADISQRGEMAQERTFIESSLPLTIELAVVVKAIILPLLHNTPATWPYADRVISCLLPMLREDIQRFHGRNGPSLSKMMKEHGLKHLDNDLLVRLCAVVEKARPGLLAQLQELSAAHRDQGESL